MMWQPGVTLDEVEKEVILKALQFYQGNRTHTAKALGISPRGLYDKLKLYGYPNEPLPAEEGITHAENPSKIGKKK